MVKHGKLIFEYNKISKYIYLGTNQCCITHFKQELLKKGVQADLSLEKEKLDAPFGVKYFLWLPVKDHTSPSLKQMIMGCSFIKHCVNNKIPIYIHCQQGHGRAPTMLAAYLIQEKELSVTEAIASIKKKRKSIHPNTKQKAALKRYQAYLKKKK